jgi:hypothetical protein
MKSRIQIVGMVLVLTAVPAALAQSAEEKAKRERQMFYMAVPGPGTAEHTFEFIASELSFDGSVVKNAPYSADAVTETTQRLADGNRISNRTTASLYRDSDGRTRREDRLGSIGALASNSEPLKTIFINDPVSGSNMVLDTRNKIARKMPSPKIRMAGMPPNGMIGVAGSMVGPASGAVAMTEMRTNVSRHVTVRNGGEPDVLVTSATSAIPVVHEFGAKDAQKESLGSQMIEGVRADGTRTTLTIPAGAIGNEQPIQIVSERWYSPELQTVVMTKRNDPRTGETVYRLTNINRSEPPRSMFEAPADYTVEDAKPFNRELNVLEDKIRIRKD